MVQILAYKLNSEDKEKYFCFSFSTLVFKRGNRKQGDLLLYKLLLNIEST